MTSNSKRPFIKRFKTHWGYYVYDINTNRVLTVDGVVYEILGDYGYLPLDEIRQKYTPKYGGSCVEHALDEIEDARNNENLFLSDRPQALSLGLTPVEFQRAYKTQLHQMILDITEFCNLRCHYCSREGMQTDAGNYKRKSMSIQTAFAAINFFHAHSSQVEDRDRALSFYGGEPLIEFNLIQRCVEYAQSKFGDEGVHFALTTNGVLLNENMAKYFAENRFNITVSVDGPQRIHDKYRIDWAGNGSYEQTINGLRLLYKTYGADAHSKILINMVVTPPYDLDALNDLWIEQSWLPKDIITVINYVETEGTNFLEEYPSFNQSYEIHHRTKRRALSTFKRSCLNKESASTPVAKALNEISLLRIYKRPLTPAPRKVSPLNGCCVPGVRRIFVTCDGELKLCEKASGSPVLGSVNGYDPRIMWSILDEYAKESIHDCRRCWAVNLCSICFDKAYRNGKFDITHKRAFCRSKRKQLAAGLKTFCSILERDRHALDYMEKIEYK